ncbi:MAG: putative rane protein [Thermomicrobiales bacterium]|jgi:putative membrane protein|nr:putative rane protein [Thermomicrobiales bacterium]MEA2531693.1 putative rane protein [Thermomicrobiales bacterium]MEA2585756.1 putative rane protein [Thermomicrobiales bacterium]
MGAGRLAAYIIGSMIAVLTLGTIFRDRFVTYESEAAVLIFAGILGVLTAYIKPLLTAVTLPLTCLTFGLFLVVLNVGVFALAALLTPGLEVNVWGAAIGALFTSIANGIVFSIVDEE